MMIERDDSSMARRFALAALCCVALTGGLACSVDEGGLGPNTPPETVLTFTGPVNAVNSHVRLKWWGEDPDGSVVGYEYRWAYEDETAPGDWIFTAATTDSFALPAPNGAAAHVFFVRAVDDDGASDPTPAEQRYAVNNTAPRIAFENPGALPTESLPAVTIAFETFDDDGDASVKEVVAWLDGQDPDSGRRVAASTGFVTFRPEDFDTYGARTIFLKAIDDGLSESLPISHEVVIVEPVGRLIVVDDMPDNIVGGTTQTDPFYRSVVAEVMGDAPYTVHKIERGPLRTADEASAILSLFDVVVWYQGTNFADAGVQTAVGTASLRNAETAIRELLARGGRMYLETMNAIGTGDHLSEGFVRDVLGVDTILENAEAETSPDTNFFLKLRYYTGQPLWWLETTAGPAYQDVRAIGTFWGLELFQATPAAEVLYTIPPDIVFSGQPRVTVATRVDGQGTMLFFGFPLSRCSFEQRHREVFGAILRDELGLPNGP